MVVLDTAITYDLKQRSYRKIANIPDAIQNPAVCAHKNEVYTVGHKNIYKYEDCGDSDRWRPVLMTDIRTNCMLSFKDHIYCTQNYFSSLYRFKPGIDSRLEVITTFGHPPASICNLGDRIIAFTRAITVQADILAVEEYTASTLEEKPKNVWLQQETGLMVNDVAGSCALVMTVPPVYPAVSPYHKRYLSRYEL